MPAYKVLQPGTWAGILRTPDGPHDPVQTTKPIPKDKMPSWLEPLAGPTPAQKRAATKKAKKEQEAHDKKLDFTGNSQSNDGVETL